jgi:hypothetical protein
METRPEEEKRGDFDIPDIPKITLDQKIGRREIGSNVVGVSIENLVIRDSINRLGRADPANVQQIAASQLELLAGYHEIALAQSRRSFFWALVGSGLGLSFFVAAVAFALTTGIALTAVIPLLSGAIVEVVAGLVFVLYGKTTSQLSNFHSRLEVLQRYLLANSLCESLDGEERNKTRAALIREIFRPQPAAVENSSGAERHSPTITRRVRRPPVPREHDNQVHKS